MTWERRASSGTLDKTYWGRPSLSRGGGAHGQLTRTGEPAGERGLSRLQLRGGEGGLRPSGSPHTLKPLGLRLATALSNKNVHGWAMDC